jgi:hypothetical protein
MKAAIKSRDFVRFEYSLSASDSLFIESHEDIETSIGPYDTGFVMKRGGDALKRVSVQSVPQIRREYSDESDKSTPLPLRVRVEAKVKPISSLCNITVTKSAQRLSSW